MRMSQRAFAAAAVIASLVVPAVMSASPASAIEESCLKTTGEPKTVDFVVGSITLDRVPTGVDWSECVD